MRKNAKGNNKEIGNVRIKQLQKLNYLGTVKRDKGKCSTNPKAYCNRKKMLLRKISLELKK